MTRLCTVSDVNQYVDTTGRWENSEVEDAIDFIEEELKSECGVIKSVYSLVDSDYSEYYLGERNIYRIDNVLYGDVGSQVSLSTTNSEYTEYLDQGIIVLSTTTIDSHGSVSWPEDYIEIEFVPKIFNKYCAARVAQHLLEKSHIVSGESAEQSLNVISKRVDALKQKIMDGVGPILTSDNSNYDYEYNIGRRRVVQDHDRNKDLLRNS